MTIFLDNIDVRNDPHGADDLIGKLLEQGLGVDSSNRLSVIVFANIKSTAISIGIAADPLEIVVLPGFLPFSVGAR